MLIRINKGDYNLVVSDTKKKVRVKGEKWTSSVGTEEVNHPVEYEEVNDEENKSE